MAVKCALRYTKLHETHKGLTELSGIPYTEFHPLLSRNIAITGCDLLAPLSTGAVFSKFTDIPQRFEKYTFTEFHKNLKKHTFTEFHKNSKSILVPNFIKNFKRKFLPNFIKIRKVYLYRISLKN